MRVAIAGMAVTAALPAPAFAQIEMAEEDSSSGASEAITPAFAGQSLPGSVVSDADLSTMRGRFVTPNGISYFGLEMATIWQTPDGITTQAKLAINFDFAAAGGNPTAQVFVSWNRDEADDTVEVGQQSQPAGLAISNSGNIPVGGLNSVHGAVQSQQIAGADNSVRNAMTVAIVPSADAKVDTTGMTPLLGNSTQTFADGDTLRFLVGGKEVGLVMTGGGADVVRQTVNSDANQLAQHALVNSSENDITSRMSLNIGMDPSSQLNRMGANNLLNAMRNNGF